MVLFNNNREAGFVEVLGKVFHDIYFLFFPQSYIRLYFRLPLIKLEINMKING